MIIAFTASWEVTEASATMMASIDAGRMRMKATDQEFAYLLGVSPSRISAMRAGLDGGPAVLRFGNLPAAFWLGFAQELFPRFCFRVIEDCQIDKLIAIVGLFTVTAMRRDMARMYSPEQIAALDAADDKRRA